MAQQIKKKFIADNAIDGTKIKLEESQAIRGVKSGVEVDMLKFDENGVLFSEEKELSFKSDMESHVESIRSTLDASIQQEVSDRQSGDASLQSELDSTQSGAGLESDGSFSQHVGSNYIDLAVSLKDSDLKLDAQVKLNENAISQEVSDRQSEVTRVEGLLSNEESARISADNALSSRLDSLELDSVTKAYVDAADSSLDSKITTEKERIDAILLASEANKDSFAEIVQLINSVDTENDQAFASYVLSNDAALAQEVQDRTDADTNLQSNIDAVSGNLDQEILNRQADVNAEETRALAAEGVLQGNIDQEVSDRQSEISRVEGLLSDEESARVSEDLTFVKLDGSRNMTGGLTIDNPSHIAKLEIMEQDDLVNMEYIDAGETYTTKIQTSYLELKSITPIGTQSSAIGSGGGNFSDINGIVNILDGRIRVINKNDNSARMPTLETHLTPKKYVDDEISVEQSRALAAEGVIEANLDQEIADRQSEVTRVEGLLSDEESARIAADNALSGRLDSLELDSVTKAYVDTQDSGLQSQIDTEKSRIDAILLASEADKDSFAEIVSLINSVDTENDSAFASYVLSNDARSTQIESDLAQEVLDRAAADSTLQGNVDVVSANLAQEILDRQADVDAEETRALAAESVLQGNIDSEESARIAADQELDGRLDILEGKVTVEDMKFEVDGTTVLTSHILLPHLADKIFKVCINRLNAFKGVDYTVSEENGQTKLTFIGDLASDGVSPVASGDNIYVTYEY